MDEKYTPNQFQQDHAKWADNTRQAALAAETTVSGMSLDPGYAPTNNELLPWVRYYSQGLGLRVSPSGNSWTSIRDAHKWDRVFVQNKSYLKAVAPKREAWRLKWRRISWDTPDFTVMLFKKPSGCDVFRPVTVDGIRFEYKQALLLPPSDGAQWRISFEDIHSDDDQSMPPELWERITCREAKRHLI